MDIFTPKLKPPSILDIDFFSKIANPGEDLVREIKSNCAHSSRIDQMETLELLSKYSFFFFSVTALIQSGASFNAFDAAVRQLLTMPRLRKHVQMTFAKFTMARYDYDSVVYAGTSQQLTEIGLSCIAEVEEKGICNINNRALPSSIEVYTWSYIQTEILFAMLALRVGGADLIYLLNKAYELTEELSRQMNDPFFSAEKFVNEMRANLTEHLCPPTPQESP